MDFNRVIDDFADLVANKIVARLGNTIVEPNHWPPVTETQDVPDVIETKNEREPVQVKVVSNDYDARRVTLGKYDVRTLRKQLSAAGGGSLEEFKTLSKPDLIEKSVAYEQLIGHSLEDEIAKSDNIPDDTDLSEPEPEDDNDIVELTRESALELSLPKLREIASQQGLNKTDWEGLDVEPLVALIFGDKVETPAEEDDDEGYTEDEIRGMSLAELKNLVAEVKEQLDIVVEYDRSIGQSELADKIIEALS